MNCQVLHSAYLTSFTLIVAVITIFGYATFRSLFLSIPFISGMYCAGVYFAAPTLVWLMCITTIIDQHKTRQLQVYPTGVTSQNTHVTSSKFSNNGRRTRAPSIPQRNSEANQRPPLSPPIKRISESARWAWNSSSDAALKIPPLQHPTVVVQP
ncbi:hypothetical protein BJ742DRAFT_455748 [Cladochytrium replicatum]|nr:hypothetical protein BJ742DRAFT_455748 [Cladochytrium replicatum]